MTRTAILSITITQRHYRRCHRSYAPEVSHLMLFSIVLLHSIRLRYGAPLLPAYLWPHSHSTFNTVITPLNALGINSYPTGYQTLTARFTSFFMTFSLTVNVSKRLDANQTVLSNEKPGRIFEAIVENFSLKSFVGAFGLFLILMNSELTKVLYETIITFDRKMMTS